MPGRRRGHFEAATGGTIVLNELGEMPLLAPSKRLTVLDLSSVPRLGGETPTPVDARIIAATSGISSGTDASGAISTIASPCS